MGGEDDDEEEGAGDSPANVDQKPIEIPPGCYDVGDGCVLYHVLVTQ